MGQITILIALAVLVSVAGGQNIRYDIDNMTPTQIASAKTALAAIKNDAASTGFKAMYALHGEPASCGLNYCCVHNEAKFIYWHRAFCLHAEETYKRKGLQLFYWDWSKNMTALPSLFTDLGSNPWVDTTFSVPGESGTTVRDVDPQFFNHTQGEPTYMCTLILAALQETNFCEFATQLEIAHNNLHVTIGGDEYYSMSYIGFACMDPMFPPVHAYVDKVFAVWQMLRAMEGISYSQYDYSNCNPSVALNTRMQPFYFFSNPYSRVKNNAKPNQLYNITALNYTYDNYNICGYTPEQLYAQFHGQAQSQARSVAMLQPTMGADPSTESVEVCSDELNQCEFAGNVSMLGYGKVKKDKPIRVYRFDVTQAVNRAGFKGKKGLRAKVKRHIHKKMASFETAAASSVPDPEHVISYFPIESFP